MKKQHMIILAIWLGTLLQISASHAYSHHSSPVTVTVLSDSGKEFIQYPIEQSRDQYRAYLEAKKGRNYRLHLQNNTHRRVGVVVAVDGRNAIDGSRSDLSANERMVILAPFSSSTIKGWQTSQYRANRFYFTKARNSYAAAWGDRSAMGVIATAVFFEKRRANNKPHRDLTMKRHSRRAEPGTGYGESSYSPVREVAFRPQKHSAHLAFIKYEWRKKLIKLGIIEPSRRVSRPYNRFWQEPAWSFAPPPPARHYRR